MKIERNATQRDSAPASPTENRDLLVPRQRKLHLLLRRLLALLLLLRHRLDKRRLERLANEGEPRFEGRVEGCGRVLHLAEEQLPPLLTEELDREEGLRVVEVGTDLAVDGEGVGGELGKGQCQLRREKEKTDSNIPGSPRYRREGTPPARRRLPTPRCKASSCALP
jgi:hypothetical protein